MLARHKLDNLLDRFAEIEHMMSSNPDPSSYVKLSREYAGLEPLVQKIRALIKAEEDLADAESLISDPETDENHAKRQSGFQENGKRQNARNDLTCAQRDDA